MVNLEYEAATMGANYMTYILESIETGDTILTTKLSDKFSQFLIDTVQGFNSAAEELESNNDNPICEKEFKKMARTLRRKGKKYLRLYYDWMQYQKQGKIPTEFSNFGELENIANGKD